ncbi:methyltransferase [Fusarium denticulatum]|uniref:Methyltransferase n=1 Tax=Fusarium denticulatum TaxID=48507 RepID=A0A8H5XLI3_9HYPO|nr:methyltransferase [Fusarium denticulatum]
MNLRVSPVALRTIKRHIDLGRSAAFFFTFARAQLLSTTTLLQMSQKSPKSGSPRSPRSPHSQEPVATAVEALEVDDLAEGKEDDPGLGEDSESSTASITSSILHYRTITGRTYHSERGNAAYWHHMFTLSQDGELYFAPLDDKIQCEARLGVGTVGPIFIKASKTIGNTFTVVGDDLQRPGIEKAGFTDVKQWDSKLPLNPFPKDPKLKQIGQFGELFSTQDTEGLVLFVANTLGWTPEEVHVYIAKFRREIRDRRNHPYIRLRTVWARKPEEL